MTSPVGIGIIGPGFMGGTHARAFESARRAGLPCHVAAVAPGGFGQADAGNLPLTRRETITAKDAVVHDTIEALLADPRVHAVSICTPTDTHVTIAMQALAAGKHVLVEKPVALSSAAVAQLAEGARDSGLVCMPGMCMRFWPGWTWLRDRVRGGDLGAVRSAQFERLGSRPTWSPEFYRDPARCGGAIFDLHVHDVDFIMHLFGAPESVSAIGTIDRVTTLYRFASGPAHVTADGGWVETPGFPFRMRFTVEFDGGAADFDLARQQPLRLHTGGARPTIVPIKSGAGYEGQAVAFIRAVLAHREGQREAPPVTLDEALRVIRVIEAEVRGLTTGGAQAVA